MVEMYTVEMCACSTVIKTNLKRFLTRNSSGDEIANVNFLYDDIVHALKMQ